MSINAEKIRKLDSKQLSKLYLNAFKIISSVEKNFGIKSDFENQEKREKYPDAKEVIKLIKSIWKEERAQSNTKKDSKYPNFGILKKLGYSRLYSIDAKTRIFILKDCIKMNNSELPFTLSPSHMDTWGEKDSPRRYAKIMVYLQNQIMNQSKASEETKDAWKDDLAEIINSNPHKNVNEWFSKEYNGKHKINVTNEPRQTNVTSEPPPIPIIITKKPIN